MQQVDTSIFKAYDIRGVYPTQLDEDLAYRVGCAFAKLMQKENPTKKLNIVVGKDMRLSSDTLESSLVSGLIDMGVNVTKIGLVSTPTFYFATGFYNFDGGIEVSASHNPKEYNGFKLVRAHSVPISGDTGIEDIKNLAVENKFDKPSEKGLVSIKKNVLADLIKEQTKNLDLTKVKPLKIVVDAANAMGAIDVEAMFKNIPIQLIKLNFNLDGNFPVHEADPLKDENLAVVQKAVLAQQADLGIAPDGDGDRYFFVDEKGEILRQEILRGIMAQIAIKENPGATVCYDIRPGKITKDMIEEAGGRAFVTRVGHSLIKESMLKEDAVFGGESSGHYFYKSAYGTFEMPTILVLKFLIWLSGQNKPLSEVIAPLKKYFHSGEINSEVADKEGKIKALEEKYADAEISLLDGITITYPDFWFNVRPSNTENKLRLNLEAISKEIMEQKRDEVLNFIRS